MHTFRVYIYIYICWHYLFFSFFWNDKIWVSFLFTLFTPQFRVKCKVFEVFFFFTLFDPYGDDYARWGPREEEAFFAQWEEPPERSWDVSWYLTMKRAGWVHGLPPLIWRTGWEAGKRIVCLWTGNPIIWKKCIWGSHQGHLWLTLPC